MKLNPLYDRVVIRRGEDEKKTAGGIVIPDSATKEKSAEGEVVAVGTGKLLDNGQVRPLTVKVGDQVLFGKYAGTEVEVAGEKWLVMREDDILAIKK